MLYFANGSNLDWTQMKKRCPSTEFVCKAMLKDHRLAFTRLSKDRSCGVADVIHDLGKEVWGVVYEIAEQDIGQLDQSEGFNPGRPRELNAYVREQCRVYSDGNTEKPLLVSVYIANKQENPPPPNDEYKMLIVSGAKFWHLPEDYIKKELEQIQVEP